MNISPYARVTVGQDQQQLEQHGSASFPVALFEYGKLPGPVAWHWHEHIEIVVVLEGCLLVGVGTGSVPVHAGDFLLIKPGALHCSSDTDCSSVLWRNVVFHPRLIGAIDSCFWTSCVQPLREPNTAPFVLISADDDNKCVALLNQLFEARETAAPGYENDVRYLLTKILGIVTRLPQSEKNMMSEREARDTERMKLMLSFLDEHYAEEITLSQIAKSALISPTECMRCFRRTVHATPISFLREFRLQRAAFLLASTRSSIADIASACGFQDMSYFAKSFRALYAMTPTAYRRTHSAVESHG